MVKKFGQLEKDAMALILAIKLNTESVKVSGNKKKQPVVRVQYLADEMHDLNESLKKYQKKNLRKVL